MDESKDEQFPLDEGVMIMRNYDKLRGRAFAVDINAAAGKFVALAASMYLIVNGSPDFVKEKFQEIHQVATTTAVGLLGLFYVSCNWLQTIWDNRIHDYRSAIVVHEIKEKIGELEQKIASLEEPKTDSRKTEG